MKTSIFVVYFEDKADLLPAYEQALEEGTQILLVGCGGQNPHTERPFIVFAAKEGLSARTIAFLTENGVNDVHSVCLE